MGSVPKLPEMHIDSHLSWSEFGSSWGTNTLPRLETAKPLKWIIQMLL